LVNRTSCARGAGSLTSLALRTSDPVTVVPGWVSITDRDGVRHVLQLTPGTGWLELAAIEIKVTMARKPSRPHIGADCSPAWSWVLA
jgi:hypothetical protein